MVMLRLPALLLALLLLLPVAAQARLTLGWVKGAAILGTEDQARQLAAYLEARLAEPVVLRACADEAQLHEWLHRYRMIDLAPVSQGYFQRVPAGQLLPVAELKAGTAVGQMVLRQGFRSDQQLQLRTLLANLPEEPAGRDLLTSLGLRLSSPAGAPRARLAVASPSPAPPMRAAPSAVVWPDEPVAAKPVAPAAKVVAPEPPNSLEPVEPPTAVSPAAIIAAPALPLAGPEASSLPEPQASPISDMPPAAVVPVADPVLSEQELLAEPAAPPAEVPTPKIAVVEPPTPLPAPVPEKVVAPVVAPAVAATVVEPPAPPTIDKPVPVVAETAPPVLPAAKVAVAPPAPTPKPSPQLAALPPKPAVALPAEVQPKLSGETVSRSLSSGRQPLADFGPLQTIYLVPFTTIMVPVPVAEAVFDRFVETLNENGPAAGYEFVILKDDLERVDPAWLRKATYVTGEIFGYVEESGCCSTDIRSKSRLALYRPGSGEPKLRHEYPAKAFFDHDYSTLDAERKKLAERISLDLSNQLIKALGGS